MAEELQAVNRVLCGDSLEVLKTQPAKSVQTIFTSPPYMALRDYGVEGQIGLEASSELYLEKLWAIFDECKRVLSDTGVCWVNLGDTFAGSGGAGGDYNDGGLKEGQPKWKQDTYRHLQADPTAHRRNNVREAEFQAKCLMMIPERFAWGMIRRGWILRAKVVWYKPNGMIESSKDRPKLDYEMLYMFSKQQKYWFNYIEAKKPLKSVTVKRYEYDVNLPRCLERFDGKTGFKPARLTGPKIGGTKHSGNNGNNAYSGNVWEKPTDGMAKIGSVWGLPPESIWSIAPKTFGHEYCETCDKLVKSRDLLFKCKDCQTVYEIVKAKIKEGFKKLTELFQGEELSPLGIPESELEGCPKCQSRKRDLVCPTCKNKVHMHFAMFPEELVIPALKMTCPDQVCVKCGKPRFPVYTPTEEYAKLLGKGWHDHSDDEEAGMQQEKDVPYAKADYRIKEWTDCGCGAGFEPGVMLDPFAGFNTVGAVAMKHGRNFIGIDLDPRNVKAGMKRVEPYVKQTRLA